ncbi:hypothetical protein GF325_00585 [Candidatus Bathyarchaeota archaeon]|nr:hypothetical protein [Candidatus Bathyarchaeota archaeon]
MTIPLLYIKAPWFIEMNDKKREKLMISKRLAEEEHFKRLQSRGFDSITIADRLIHATLDALMEGFRSKFPGISERDLIRRMREHFMHMQRLKQEVEGSGRVS